MRHRSPASCAAGRTATPSPLQPSRLVGLVAHQRQCTGSPIALAGFVHRYTSSALSDATRNLLTNSIDRVPGTQESPATRHISQVFFSYLTQFSSAVLLMRAAYLPIRCSRRPYLLCRGFPLLWRFFWRCIRERDAKTQSNSRSLVLMSADTRPRFLAQCYITLSAVSFPVSSLKTPCI